MILKARGIDIREPERGLSFADDEVRDWISRYESGESMASIAFSAGVKSPETIRKRLVDVDVSIRERVSSTASSWQEWAIYFYLSKAFPDGTVSSNLKVETAKGARFPDVCLTTRDGIKVAVEYDGEFWHDTPARRKADEEKTALPALLQDCGFRVIRVIENAKGVNETVGGTVWCSAERNGNDVGIGFAIIELLNLLESESIDVDLERDMPEINKLYYEAKNRTKHGIEWARLYTEDGLASHAIAKRFGTTSTTVTTALESLGVEIRHQPTSEKRVSQWAQMLHSGASVQDIADDFGVSKSTVYRALKRRGHVFDPHPKKAITVTDHEWKRLFCEEELSMSKIAREYGVSAGTVSSHLRKTGVS